MFLELKPDDGQFFRPPLFKQIETYGGRLFYRERNFGHPLSLSNHSWTAVEAALEKVLDCYDLVSAAFSVSPNRATSSNSFSTLIDAHREYIYRNAEFLETITGRVAASFVQPNDKIKLPGSIKEMRRHTDLICNQLKHEQNRLAPLAALSRTAAVPGYFVCAVDSSNSARPNSVIHKERRGFSFATDIRRILVDAFGIGAKVGSFIEDLKAPTIASAVTVPSSSTRIALLKRIEQLPLLVFPFERPRHMPILRFDREKLLINNQGGNTLQLQPPTTMHTIYKGDGVTRVFEVP